MNFICTSTEQKEMLKKRFLTYVKTWTESDGQAADRGTFPSTSRQFDLANILKDQLAELGIKNAQVTKDCYVYAYIDGTGSKAKNPPVLFLAHMDTVDEVSGKDIKPVITQKNDDTIISSDKTTLLGADDKAGVAAIMQAVTYLIKHPQLDHCPVEVMFSPDEETGHGMDKVPLELIKAKYAYTVDGGQEGELEAECFNAWSGKVTFTGKACHTGSAKKDGMVNAVFMGADFVSHLPHDLRPETTENHQGFIAPMEINATIEKCEISLLLRSFSLEEIDKEKKIIEETADKTVKSFGGKREITFKQQYLNMKDRLDKEPFVLEKLEKAYKAAGVKIIKNPIRGGTDGSRLTEMGIPTPNIFTGAHEIHSRNEWCSLNQMAKASDVIINICLL